MNQEEAFQVREIFSFYLEYESLLKTVKEMDNRRWTTKKWTTKKGRIIGGKPFNKNNLFKL